MNGNKSLPPHPPRGDTGTAPGFTLIETVITLGIFVMVMLTVTNVYLVYSQAQNAANLRQKVLNETSFLTEKIAQEVRLGEIIYSGAFDYDNNPATNNLIYSLDGDSDIIGRELELALTDSAGNQVIYVFDDSGAKVCPEFSQIGLYKYTQSGKRVVCESVFDPAKLEVLAAGFYISPSFNPYPDSDEDCKRQTSGEDFNGYYCLCSLNSECYSGSCQNGMCTPINFQPRVTFYLVIEDKSPASVKPLLFQTTVSGRTYKR